MGNPIVKHDRIGVVCSLIDVRGMEIAAETDTVAQLVVREADSDRVAVVWLNRLELNNLYIESSAILGGRPPAPRR